MAGVVALIAVGAGVAVSILSVLGAITQDPIPGRSDSLYSPRFDPRSEVEMSVDASPPKLLSWIDANNLARGGPSGEVALSAGGVGMVTGTRAQRATKMNLRYANAAFFGTFDVPFKAGSGWSSADDTERSRYVVLSSDAAARLFGDKRPVGERVVINGTGFSVLGVVGKWDPTPRFYDLSKGGFNTKDEVFLPLSTAMQLKLPVVADFNCWGAGWSQIAALETASCGWLTMWVHLPDQSGKQAYLTFLRQYYSSQKESGRFELPANVSLQGVEDYLDEAGLVTPELKLQTYLAYGLLSVCLINAAALLLSLSLRRRREFALRRALGASQLDIVNQALFEGALVGLIAGVFAVLVSFTGLYLLARLPTLYSSVIHGDPNTFVAAIVLSVVASVTSSLFPAWASARAKPLNNLNVE